MFEIKTNPTGTRSIAISDEHLKTIDEYNLFNRLIDSNGIVDESVLDKLKLTVRSLISSQDEPDKALLNLSFDVLFHKNMKAYGLYQLATLYVQWKNNFSTEDAEDTDEN